MFDFTLGYLVGSSSSAGRPMTWRDLAWTVVVLGVTGLGLALTMPEDIVSSCNNAMECGLGNLIYLCKKLAWWAIAVVAGIAAFLALVGAAIHVFYKRKEIGGALRKLLTGYRIAGAMFLLAVLVQFVGPVGGLISPKTASGVAILLLIVGALAILLWGSDQVGHRHEGRRQ